MRPTEKKLKLFVRRFGTSRTGRMGTGGSRRTGRRRAGLHAGPAPRAPRVDWWRPLRTRPPITRRSRPPIMRRSRPPMRRLRSPPTRRRSRPPTRPPTTTCTCACTRSHHLRIPTRRGWRGDRDVMPPIWTVGLGGSGTVERGRSGTEGRGGRGGRGWRCWRRWRRWKGATILATTQTLLPHFPRRTEYGQQGQRFYSDTKVPLLNWRRQSNGYIRCSKGNDSDSHIGGHG
jgi:hypothetical protein